MSDTNTPVRSVAIQNEVAAALEQAKTELGVEGELENADPTFEQAVQTLRNEQNQSPPPQPTQPAAAATTSFTDEQITQLRDQLGLNQPQQETQADRFLNAYTQDPVNFVERILETNPNILDRLAERSAPDPWAEIDENDLDPATRALKADNDALRAQIQQMNAQQAEETERQRRAQQAAQQWAADTATIKQQHPQITEQDLRNIATEYRTRDPNIIAALVENRLLKQQSDQQNIAQAQRLTLLPHNTSENAAPPTPIDQTNLPSKQKLKLMAQQAMAHEQARHALGS